MANQEVLRSPLLDWTSARYLEVSKEILFCLLYERLSFLDDQSLVFYQFV
jgi:hypothetical protein